MLDSKYITYKNVLTIDYEDFVESETNNLDNIADLTMNKLCEFLPKEVLPETDLDVQKLNIIDRITKMNKLIKDIENRPFAYFDNFFSVHGGHRNRRQPQWCKNKVSANTS